MKKQVTIITCAVLAAVLIAMAFFVLLNREPVVLEPVIVEVEVPNRVAAGIGGGNVVITADNFDEAMQASRTHEEMFGHFMAEMNAVWTFPNASSASTDAFVSNSVANVVPVFFEVELEATGEVVYTSPVMPVGSHIENLTLDAQLEQGEHPAIITFFLLDEEGVYQSTVSLVVTLVIQGYE